MLEHATERSIRGNSISARAKHTLSDFGENEVYLIIFNDVMVGTLAFSRLQHFLVFHVSLALRFPCSFQFHSACSPQRTLLAVTFQLTLSDSNLPKSKGTTETRDPKAV